ncbi:MAG: aspartate 1-decarboxylase [Verrucomicrobia bacterium]|nr:aspartate 1-decarboxylase [Verrucomicrobiota bacterium]
MLRQMLKSKIHRATITCVQPDYEGSIACDPELLRTADIQLERRIRESLKKNLKPNNKVVDWTHS